MDAAWARGVGRFDADDAGRAHPRSAARGPPQRVRQDAADGARAATRSASVEARDPRAVPGSRAVRRDDRRRRSRELGVSRQTGIASVACGSRVARRCCRNRRAACGRTASPSAPASHATRCSRAWRRKACGRADDVREARIEPVVARALEPPRHAQLLAQRLRDASPRAARIRSTIDNDLQRMLEERVAAYFSDLPPRTSAALLVVDNATLEARAYVGSVEFGDPAAPRARRHGEGLAFARFDAQALPLRPRARRWPDPFRKPAGRCAAIVRRLPARQLRHGVQRAGRGVGSLAPVLERAGGRSARSRRPRAFRRAPGERGHRAEVAAGRGAEPRDDPRRHGRAAGRSRRCVCGAESRRHRGSRAVSRRMRRTSIADCCRPVRRGSCARSSKRIRAPAASPTPSIPRSRMRVAWKTGTSYGYRDAWALGSTRRYTVGVWVGRPDGTPLPGQYGAMTALPLLFETIDSLPTARGRRCARARRRRASKRSTCAGRSACRPIPRRPRCAASKREGVDARRQRAADLRRARCARCGMPASNASMSTHAPANASPPSARDRTCDARLESRAGPRSHRPGCRGRHALRRDCRALRPIAEPDGRDAGESLRIDGLVDRATLARPSNSTAPLRLSVRALGSEARIRWLIDGRLVGETRGASSFDLHFAQHGAHTLTALAETGAWSTVDFRVLQ